MKHCNMVAGKLTVSGTHTAKGNQSVNWRCHFYLSTLKNRKVGVKMWWTYSVAKLHYDNQVIAAKGECGPKVLSKLLPIVKSGKKHGYGYVTQLAKVDPYKCYDKCEIAELDKKFRRCFGMNHGDFHEANVGYLRGKRLVYIDFDPM